ncbi:MAG: tetratricopeptide repeat protein [Pirellulales bacterium]
MPKKTSLRRISRAQRSQRDQRRHAPPSYDYDAALSFAGEDRKLARTLAGKLTSSGLRVFYDHDHKSYLWGKSQDEFKQICGPRSRFVVPFISQHYVTRDWPLFEFGIAKREEKKRKVESILPIRIDDSQLVGLPDHRIYLSLDEDGIDGISAALVLKCKSAYRESSVIAQVRGKSVRPHASILSPVVRRILGLVATSGMPLTVDHFRVLFKDIDWARYTRTLVSHKLLFKHGRLLYIPKQLVSTLLEAPKERQEFERQWISTLEPLGLYMDMAPCLALHYITAGRLEDAVILLTSVASAVQLGKWNSLYISALKSFRLPKAFRKLKLETRLELYNALGICLSHAGRFDEALASFKNLRMLAKKHRKPFWVGQSYLNAGVACFKAGRTDAAIGWYKRARQHGLAKRDLVLAARAGGNWAESIGRSAPDQAKELLRESIRLKRKGRDRKGLAAAELQLGNIEAVNGNHDRAIRHYEKCLAVGERLDLPYEQALSLHNLGNAHRASGRLRKAIECLKRSHRIAVECGYEDIQMLASTGLGCVFFELKRFNEAKEAFTNLLTVAKSTRSLESQVCALHGCGILEILRGNVTLGRRTIGKALQIAFNTDNPHWVVRCLVDRLRPLSKGALGAPDLEKLKGLAITKRRQPVIAAQLWTTTARALAQSNSDPRRVREAYRNAILFARKVSEERSRPVELLGELHCWLWQSGYYLDSLKVLRESEALARSSNLHTQMRAAIDQRGVCLQELGRIEEAISLHQKVVRLARSSGDLVQTEISLNNLGESLRKVGRFAEAAQTLGEAESVAVQRGSHESAISIAHNRALAVQQNGDEPSAARIFAQCRDRALSKECWSEYIRALEGLANLACEQARVKLARSRYKLALTEATRHGQAAMAPRIALNYARFLQWVGQPSAALRELQMHEQTFARYLDSCRYDLTLGELHESVGNRREAVTHLERAKSSALGLGDDIVIVACASHLAAIHDDNRQFAASIQELEFALTRGAGPKKQADLLCHLLRMYLARGDDKGTEKVFNRARTLAESHNLDHRYIDIHMILGEHQWKGARESKLDALKAFTVALVRAFEILVSERADAPENSTALADVSRHVLHTLTHPKYAPSEKQWSSLSQDLDTWLVQNLKWHRSALARLIWPIHISQKLRPYVNRPKRLGTEMRRLLANDDSANEGDNESPSS